MLLRKMLRDMKRNSTQFISIFLMIFIGIFIFTGMNAISFGMKLSAANFYKDMNLTDALIHGNKFTPEDVNALTKEEGIDLVERRLQINASLEEDSRAVLQINVVENNLISSNYIVEGESFQTSKEGIWLSNNFAEANDLKVGDYLSINVYTEKITLKVIGLILNPEYVYAVKDDTEMIPDYKLFGYGYIAYDGYTDFEILEEIGFNQLLIKTELNKTELGEVMQRVFPDRYTVLVMQKEQLSYRMFQNELDQMKAMQQVFPFVFLLIAIMTTITTMTRITAKQRVQIGTLKALGFSNNKILAHYVSYGAFTGALGGILGILTGPTFLPNIMFKFQKAFYSLPEWKGAIEPYVIAIVFVGMVLCGLSGYFACKRELRGATAQILRPKAPKLSKHTWLEKSRWWNNLKFHTQWSIRDIIRNRLRTIITIIGMVGCLTLIICAFGLRDTIQGIIQITYRDIYTYETKIGLSNTMPQEELVHLRNDNRKQFLQEAPIEIDFEDEIITIMQTVVGEGYYIKYQDLLNRSIDLPAEGVVITNKIAQMYNISIGDHIKWRNYGVNQWYVSEVKAIIRNPVNQGMFLGEEAYEQLDLFMQPTSFVTSEAANNFVGETFQSVQSIEDIINTMEELIETMNVIIAILILAAIILGVVVLYNLGVLSFHERLRELTTLKVLGFPHNTLRKLIQLQNIWLTLLGTFIGVPGGYMLLSYLLEFMGESLDLLPNITVLSYLISIIGALLLSVIVSWILSFRLKTIDMVEALKSVE